ncbi:hypothetical protein RRF57_000034 [Xylaria bambusicola]|uniref:Uncharacterized protein n=1 Tax=Xylaria bambusicola TaxID=326684 RepID=A0AAN7UA21_9PEZI
MNIANRNINSFTRESVILVGSQLRCEAIAENGLSGNFDEHGKTQDHPCGLEQVSNDVEVSGGKDHGNDAGVGNS